MERPADRALLDDNQIEIDEYSIVVSANGMAAVRASPSRYHACNRSISVSKRQARHIATRRRARASSHHPRRCARHRGGWRALAEAAWDRYLIKVTRAIQADDHEQRRQQASRRADRRRGLCRAVAGDRAAAGARDVMQGRGRRSRARARRRRSARVGDRRGGAAVVRNHRRLGADRGRRAADPRHGGHRQPPRRRHAADVPDLRRRGGAGRAVRAHDRERPAARRAAGEGAGRTASN